MSIKEFIALQLERIDGKSDPSKFIKAIKGATTLLEKGYLPLSCYDSIVSHYGSVEKCPVCGLYGSVEAAPEVKK